MGVPEMGYFDDFGAALRKRRAEEKNALRKRLRAATGALYEARKSQFGSRAKLLGLIYEMLEKARGIRVSVCPHRRGRLLGILREHLKTGKMSAEDWRLVVVAFRGERRRTQPAFVVCFLQERPPRSRCSHPSLSLRLLRPYLTATLVRSTSRGPHFWWRRGAYYCLVKCQWLKPDET